MQNAMTLHQAGRLEEAARAYRSVLAREAENADALHLLGAVRLQQGKSAEAVELIRKAADLRPASLDILGNLATAHARCGQFEQALGVLDRILTRAPRNTNALLGRSAMLLNLRRRDEALAACDEALGIEPRSAGLLFQRANVLASLERFADAVEAMDRVLELSPASVEALNNRGNALAMLGRHGEAIANYDRALAIKPDYLDALNNRANALKAAERFEEALAGYEAVLAREPDRTDALSNSGAVLIELNRPVEALSRFDRALALRPRDITVINNRSTALLHLDRKAEALANVRASLEIDPDNFEAYYFLLANGEFSDGWRLYDRRTIEGQTRKRGYAAPDWRGQKVSGTLLVSGEQGLGDQILFSSLLPELRSAADRVVAEVEPRLVDLFKRSFSGIEIVALRDKLHDGAIAAQTLIGSAAKFLRPDWNSFNRQPRNYLRADEKRVADFRRRLDGSLNVGVSWHSRKAATGRSKSAHLIDFTPLFETNQIRLIDLQYGDTKSERDAFAAATGQAVTHFDDLDLTNDIDGVAALIAACDLVVSVSNTTAHLAGALGRPAWVMPPFGHTRMWYWMDNGAGNPWYPCVQVRPQGAGQSWAQLVASIRSEVASFAGANVNR